MSRTPVSPEEIADREEMLRLMVKDGHAITEIAEVMDLSLTTIHVMSKRLNLETKRITKSNIVARSLSISELKRLKELRLDGASLSSLEQQFNLSKRYLVKVIKFHKIPYGKKCSKCGTQVTEETRPKNLWKYCKDCYRLVFNERMNNYIMGRYYDDNKFRRKLLDGMKKYQKKARKRKQWVTA